MMNQKQKKKMEKEERKSNNFRVVKKECFWWTESNIQSLEIISLDLFKLSRILNALVSNRYVDVVVYVLLLPKHKL